MPVKTTRMLIEDKKKLLYAVCVLLLIGVLYTATVVAGYLNG